MPGITATLRLPGRAVYRWKVNELFARSSLRLQLAAHGEEAGQLVQATGDSRDELIADVLASAPSPDIDEVTHAVGLFRARGADRHDKRNAIVGLARILESRRELLGSHLVTKDAAALFDIANRFDLRHRRANQLADYDDAYLDWIFWRYVATVDLVTTLAQPRASEPPRSPE